MKITNKALDQIVKNDCFLKISLDIGGCRGFKFVFEFTKQINSDYFKLFDFVLVEKVHLEIFDNFELDYISEFGYEDFILNPLSKYKTCGCGVSFG